MAAANVERRAALSAQMYDCARNNAKVDRHPALDREPQPSSPRLGPRPNAAPARRNLTQPFFWNFWGRA
jgi:hypothetical protein